MKKTNWVIIILGLCVIVSCKNQSEGRMTDEEIWKLGWRLIESSMDEKLIIAESQFDTLLSLPGRMDSKFLIKGLEVKSKLNKQDELAKLLGQQDDEMRKRLCAKDFLKDFELCAGQPGEAVKNKALQMELIQMYIDDQATRGNVMKDIVTSYGIAEEEITQDIGVVVDERNRNRLKEIFKEFGFPSKELVGKGAMKGVFLMIQHSDGDKNWQKSQLVNIKAAVKNGDMDGQSFAYLYDRIKINGGEKQLYGTQFSKVDSAENIVELAETEDLENLDERRREIGMMPIKMYKRFMLRNL